MHPAKSRPAKTSRRTPTPPADRKRNADHGQGRSRTRSADERRPADRIGPAERKSLYDEVTGRIIAELEAGRVPWVQPWGTPGGAVSGGSAAPAPGLPRNALTGRSYSGVNVLILWGAVIAHGYPSQCWLTFRQALEAGGTVRKGERGTTLVYAGTFTLANRADAVTGAGGGKCSDPDRRRGGEGGAPQGDDDRRATPFLKRFTVFNIAQCEGLRDGLAADPVPLPQREIVPVAEACIAASGVDVRVGGSRAFYVPALDYVQVPPQPAFFDQINYYRTCLHELTHATGHPSRLNRDQSGGFGSNAYAREELVAEMGAAFLCAALGIHPTVRHADYLASWLDLLHGDNRAIFRAASAATKAADWLLARHAEASATAAAEQADPAQPAPALRAACAPLSPLPTESDR